MARTIWCILACLLVSSCTAFISERALSSGLLGAIHSRSRFSTKGLESVEKTTNTSQKVLFKLYNRTNIFDPVETYNDSEDDFFTSFNATKKTVLIIGGWEPDADDVARVFPYLAEAYSEMYDCNLIHVVWYGARLKNYLKAKAQLKDAGLRTAKFIDRLVTTYNVAPEDLHIIGHSLGAHVSGIAGYNVKSGKVGRVTGLDSASPLINLSSKNESLSKDSATFVVALHTSVFGVVEPIGHVDFYANNRLVQPGCFLSDLLYNMCSHRRAYQLYAEAITDPTGFAGKACGSYWKYKLGLCKNGAQLYMNETLSSTARGSYYFSTHKTYPYAEE